MPELKKGKSNVIQVTKPKARGSGGSELKFIPVSIAELPIWLIKRLYYRPVPVRKELTARETKHHEQLGGGAPVHYLYKHVWATEETVVNKCLQAVLMAMPPEAVAKSINALVPGAGLVSPATVRLRRPKKLAKHCGEPDFLLFDEQTKSLVIGELKIGAKATNGRYSFQQLQKYMQLGLLARSALNLQRVTHLIVLPTRDVAQHCEDPDYWEPDVGNDNRLVSRNPKRFLTMRAVYEISGGKFQELLPMDVRDFMKPVDPCNPLIPVPTYVATWEAMCKMLAENCARAKAGYLADACADLQALGEGRFEGTGA